MPSITYVHPNGERQTVEVKSGTSVMQAAMAEGISGIVAECGGSAMCATCHVYVDPEFVEHVPDVQEIEDEMLECAASERRESSRLSCQLVVSDEMDGLVVHLPETQV
ncbi:2Fe-2S iron-sulfur cluster-binding protein [Chromohalobacter nigrandesensis]|uniref:2Fe-2S iron-sulfur cluster-binding protein n=1 Tax=Chromohalobacter nigrandesensis TaxID=119863 RepID=UPI001FF1F7E9|nr:2Fe-2S iron-sulfur cluster-binding protein [Chromohalobacter nigrandesensis]MCK0745198.1 2Fe-2S iron-sulfur cluster-binding protein [Chromohalobacter nigrandesensis]